MKDNHENESISRLLGPTGLPMELIKDREELARLILESAFEKVRNLGFCIYRSERSRTTLRVQDIDLRPFVRQLHRLQKHYKYQAGQTGNPAVSDGVPPLTGNSADSH